MSGIKTYITRSECDRCRVTFFVDSTGQVVKVSDFDFWSFTAAGVAWEIAIRLAMELNQISLHVIDMNMSDGDEATPSSIALSLTKQIFVKAGEDVVLQ